MKENKSIYEKPLLKVVEVETGPFRSNKKHRVINEFIEKNKYKTVFENQYFVLYLPEK